MMQTLCAGMFELNNLGVYVASPLQRWLQHLDALPPDQQADAYAAAGGWRWRVASVGALVPPPKRLKC